MELLVHNHFTLKPNNGFFADKFEVPIWEIELIDPILDSIEFESSLKDLSRYNQVNFSKTISRLYYNGTQNDSIQNLIGYSCKDKLLDIVSLTNGFKTKFLQPLSVYKEHTRQFSSIILDQPGFSMTPHMDNHDIIVQCIVNLVQDNETSTAFYNSYSETPVYQAPKKKNHGVMFVNTSGSLHGIQNITHNRWIWYSGVGLCYQN